MADQRPIHWENALTIGSVTILVGTELVGVSWAAGWALGGIFQLPMVISRGFEICGILLGIVMLYYFVRAALRAEPLRS